MLFPVADFSSANEAIAAAKDNGGGDVVFDAGDYDLNETANLPDASGVRLCGQGGGYYSDYGIAGTAATRLRWTGPAGGTMVRIQSSQRAPAKAASGGVSGIALDCNGLAGRGIHATSINGHRFEDVTIDDSQDVGFLWDCHNDRIGPTPGRGDPADNQGNIISRLRIKSDRGDAIRIDGNENGTANTSLNHFEMISLNIRDNNGFVCGFSDACTIQSLFVYRPASSRGIGLVFENDPANLNRSARHHAVYHAQLGVSGVLAKGDQGGAQPSVRNTIIGYNLGNGGDRSLPVIEPGAELSYIAQGRMHGFSSPIDAEHMRIYSPSSNHSIWDNGKHIWYQNIDKRNGDFRAFGPGDFVTFGSFACYRGFKVRGEQVMGPRIKGWTAPTGEATRSGFDTETVSLEKLAQHVKALIDDKTKQGSIGP